MGMMSLWHHSGRKKCAKLHHFLLVSFIYPNESHDFVIVLIDCDWSRRSHDQIQKPLQFSTRSKTALYAISWNWRVPVANHCLFGHHIDTRMWTLIGYPFCQFHVIQVHLYCDALTYQEGQGILSLWMEYCLGPSKWITFCRRVN